MKSFTLVFILILNILLAACVSETTGGFEAAPPSQTLDNYLRLAQGYLEQQDMVSAKRHLANAARIDPNNSEMFGLWGLVYTLEGDLQLADDSFRRALRSDSANSRVRNNYAAFLYANGRYEEAYNQLQQVVQDTTYAGRSQAFENQGLAALQLDRLDDAEYAFSRALQLNSNRIRSTLELANISLLRGNISAANRYYESFLTMQQFFNLQQSARSLWVGIQLEQARGMGARVREYGSALAEFYPESIEYALYQQLVND